jgi:hypothetical protein
MSQCLWDIEAVAGEWSGECRDDRVDRLGDKREKETYLEFH